MLGITGRDILKAAETARSPGASDERRPLSDLATRIADEAVGPVYSPVVLSGLVRLVEFAAVLALGATIYLAWVFPAHGVQWPSLIGLCAVPG